MHDNRCMYVSGAICQRILDRWLFRLETCSLRRRSGSLYLDCYGRPLDLPDVVCRGRGEANVQTGWEILLSIAAEALLTFGNQNIHMLNANPTASGYYERSGVMWGLKSLCYSCKAEALVKASSSNSSRRMMRTIRQATSW